MKTKILFVLAFAGVLLVSCSKTYTCTDENGNVTYEGRGTNWEEACNQ